MPKLSLSYIEKKTISPEITPLLYIKKKIRRVMVKPSLSLISTQPLGIRITASGNQNKS